MTTPITPVPVSVPDHPAYTPGWKTSEFWLTLAMVAGGLLKTGFGANTGAGVAGMVLSTAVTAAYSASRAYTKANAPVIAPAQSGYVGGSGRDGTA